MERSIFGIGLRELMILLLLIFTGLLPIALFYFISVESSNSKKNIYPEPIEERTETINPIFASTGNGLEIRFM